jgi:hypothetical protein
VNGAARCAFAARIETTIRQEEKMPASKRSSSGGSKRGFAAMSAEKQREIASMGGKASHGGGRPSTRGRGTSR